MRDFNVAFTKGNIGDFCNKYKFKILNKEPTCFKNYMSLYCIYLYLTNCPESFETDLSHFSKVPSKITQYRDYKSFSSTIFFEKI